jgi:signal transduction histidine kinase
MTLYRVNPEDTGRIIVPSSRHDEIGVAERELEALQSQLSGFLREKSRLADIGLAVSKINHDLRNMLASAQIVSDRLATVSDPTVQRFTPRLIRALDRAITLCVDTLRYGRSKESPPKKTAFLLRPLLTEISESLGAEELSGVRLSFAVSPTLEVFADRDQLFRVLSNLMRNALNALREARPPTVDPPIVDPMIEVTAAQEDGGTFIRVSDNGPGVPLEVRPHLFKAFQSSSREQGNGLGLVICAELMRAHGGDISLDETAEGASFVVKLPPRPGESVRRGFEQALQGRLAQGRFNR